MKHNVYLLLLMVWSNNTIIARIREYIPLEELVDDQEGNFNSAVIKETLLVDNIIKTHTLIVDDTLEAPQVIIDDATILNLTANNGYIDNLNANTLNVSGSSVVGCDVFVGCNLYIPETTASDQGVIFKYSGTTAAPITTPFLHNAGVDSLFLGENSGNFTGGNANIGIGTSTLQNNIANYNTAVGHETLKNNTLGEYNVSIGYVALHKNSLGSYNIGIGPSSLFNNTTGIGNTAVGRETMVENTIGSNNTALGYGAFGNNKTGNTNVAIGLNTLYTLTSGNDNIAIGQGAGNGIETGGGNICIGNFAGQSLTGSNSQNILIGTDSSPVSNSIKIGNSVVHTTNFQAGIRNVTAAVADTSVVSIDSNGQLGTGIITNSINLTGSTATEGNILKNGTLFIHNYGTSSTFVGLNAGNTTLTGLQNTGIGENALPGLTSGSFNTAIGKSALQSNTTGSNNTAIGVNALVLNTIGQLNTAVGSGTLALNTTGIFNTAVGGGALFLNTTGSNNTAVGVNALIANTTGQMNTAVGFESLKTNDSGANNIALGNLAGSLITTTSNNIDIGNTGIVGDTGIIRIGTTGTHVNNFQAGIRGVTAAVADTSVVSIDSNGQLGTGIITNNINLTGSSSTGGVMQRNGSRFISNPGANNTFLGLESGSLTLSGTSNTSVGTLSLGGITTGTNNIAIGDLAGSLITTESSTINIGNQGFPGISNTIFIGSAGTHTTNFQAGIFNAAALSGGTPVYIDGTNRLSTNPSSNRYKEGIASVSTQTLNAFKQLDPVSFTYIGDESHTTQYGFIAEDVEPLMPELIVYDNEGSIYTIKYHLMYALLYAWLQNLQQNQHNLEQHIINQDTVINTLRTDLNNAQSLINTLSTRLIALESLLNLNINS